MIWRRIELQSRTKRATSVPTTKTSAVINGTSTKTARTFARTYAMPEAIAATSGQTSETCTRTALTRIMTARTSGMTSAIFAMTGVTFVMTGVVTKSPQQSNTGIAGDPDQKDLF